MKQKLQDFWEAWKELTGYIGDFQSRALLTLLYFTLILPYGILVRLFSDPLRVRNHPTTTSCWVKRNIQDSDIITAKQQF